MNIVCCCEPLAVTRAGDGVEVELLVLECGAVKELQELLETTWVQRVFLYNSFLH